MAAASSRSLAAACVLAVLLAGCLATAADARRLLLVTAAMPPVADYMDMTRSPALAPGPEPGSDDLAGTMLFHGRGLLDGGIRLAGRLLLGLGL
uniref:Dirigent protein n=1 Tax=Setaria viridis TaxID=4556 RepID=A0A4U6SYF2_SETVI|nr:hypothetical protein SEVIR_9G168900v2 [Setaria viridis]